MLLNNLKNDAIFPFFWRLREQGEAGELRFLDLSLLQEGLDRKDARLSDPGLFESALYGEQGSERYSGWTMRRFRQVIERSGFDLSSETQDGFYRMVKLVPVKWGEREKKKAASWRRNDKIWAFRKSLRSRVATTSGKFAGLFGGTLLKRQASMSLNLGAGDERYENYVRVDLMGRQDIYDDIVTLEKIPSRTVSNIYTNHVLEHISPLLAIAMLKRWYEILKPGGVVRARIPDARRAISCLNREWIEVSDEEIDRMGLPNYMQREPFRKGTLDDTSVIQSVYGCSDSTPHQWEVFHQHKALWVPELARRRFEEAGFQVEFADNFGTLQTLVIAVKAKGLSSFT